MLLSLFTVSTTSALAPLCALNSELVALAVAFQTSRFLTSAAFSMLHGIVSLCNLSNKGIRISLLDFFLGLLYNVFVTFLIKAVFATAVRSTNSPCGKAIAIELQAFRLFATASFRLRHFF